MGSLVRGVSPINLPPKASSYAEMIYNPPGEAPCGRNSPSPAVMNPQAAASLPLMLNPSIIRKHLSCIFHVCDVKWAFSLILTPPDLGVDGHSSSLLQVFISGTGQIS